MKAPAFQFYVRDWLSSLTVQRMSGEQVKAYMYLICYSWLEEPRATLPNNDEELASMARISLTRWLEIKEGVIRPLILKDNRWVIERLIQVSEEQKKHQQNGKKGGNPVFGSGKPNPYYLSRKDNPQDNRKDNPQDNHSTATATATATNTDIEEKTEAPNGALSISSKRRFTDAWCSEYQNVLGYPYKFEGAKDGKAADSLLSLGIPFEELMNLAKQAWKNHTGFNCKSAVSLAGFSSRFNEIRAELRSLTVRRGANI